MPPRDGLALVRRLIERIVPGGIGVFQFPYRTEASALVSGSRWLREHVPGANAVVNTLRGHAGSQPFTPTHAYRVEDVLELFDAAGSSASYVTFDDHGDVASVMIFVESPLAGRRRSVAPSTQDVVDVKQLIASTSIEELNAAAEQYFSSLTSWDHHLAKPFSGVDEAPWLLTHFTVVLEALRLKPGLTVLEFGAGTGWASRFLTQLGCRVILLDVSATALRIAQELYARVPVIGDQPAPEFLVFDGQRIVLPDASVDRVMCLHAFHHVPNPAEMIAEFGRILRPVDVPRSPSPGRPIPVPHSRSSKCAPIASSKTTWTYMSCGDSPGMRLRRSADDGVSWIAVPCNAGPLRGLSPRRRDVRRVGGRRSVFLRNIRNFVLVKDGTERSDSRSSAGLTCELDARLGEPARAGSPIAVRVIATNVGDAIWLPRTADIGGVSLGFHVFDESGALLRTEVLSNALKEGFHEVAPGEMATLNVTLPPLPKGRYVVEIDCVADRVGWFAQLGSRPARVEVVVS
jgi:SAM-dependent methyltransferase